MNNLRLSKGSEESEPKELKSGDIVQFGVDVVENSKKGLYVAMFIYCERRDDSMVGALDLGPEG